MRASLLAVSLLVGAACAAPPEPVRVPTGPVVPTPPPSPDGVLRLFGDALLVVDSDVPVLVFTSPRGLVKVTREVGPLRVRAQFVDGPGTVQTRTFAGKYLALVEAAADGRCELIVVPQGARSEADAILRTLEVKAGNGPRPPPEPDPEPKPPEPEPKPPAPEPVKTFRVIFVRDTSATLPQGQISAMYARSVLDWLKANTTPEGGYVGYRNWSQHQVATNETPGMKAMWAAVKPKLAALPCVAVERNGTVEVYPVENSADAMLAKLKTYREGK